MNQPTNFVEANALLLLLDRDDPDYDGAMGLLRDMLPGELALLAQAAVDLKYLCQKAAREQGDGGTPA